jgi:DNA-binding GntR family transcriptional regulator
MTSLDEPSPAEAAAIGSGHERASARTKAEQAYRAVRAAILEGELAPGSAIDKQALCARLGLSRFPVGAALSRLAFEHLVDVQPQRGSFVSRIAAGETRELMHVRRGIEAELAALAAVSVTAEQAEGLARTLRYATVAAEAEDRADFHRLDLLFHAQIASALGFSYAASVLDGVRARIDRVRRLMLPLQGRLNGTLDEHRAIHAAIAAGDSAAARAAMSHHLQRVLDEFESFARDNPHLVAP